MLLMVRIDLSDADVALFDAYEARVLPLLERHGARLETRVRAIDGTGEFHLLHFPDADAFAAYRADPERTAAQPLWVQCRARSELVEVARIDPDFREAVAP